MTDLFKQTISIFHDPKNPSCSVNVSQSGTKHDSGKLPLDLLPLPALESVAAVLQFGAKKYDSYNWAKGMKWSRLEAAALRHLFAFMQKEEQDPETKLPHLAHAACCLLFLLTYQIKGLGEDDRYSYTPPSQ